MITVNVDIDGVLRDWGKSVHTVLRKYYPNKIPVKPPRITEWDTSKFYPEFNKHNFWHIVLQFRAKEIYTEAKVYKGAIDFIDALNFIDGVQVVINTHQPNRLCELYTLEWLYKNDIEYDYILMSNELDKHLVPGILIDDKVENIKPGDILFSRSWNIHSTDHHGIRMNNYKSILDYLKRGL